MNTNFKNTIGALAIVIRLAVGAIGFLFLTSCAEDAYAQTRRLPSEIYTTVDILSDTATSVRDSLAGRMDTTDLHWEYTWGSGVGPTTSYSIGFWVLPYKGDGDWLANVTDSSFIIKNYLDSRLRLSGDTTFFDSTWVDFRNITVHGFAKFDTVQFDAGAVTHFAYDNGGHLELSSVANLSLILDNNSNGTNEFRVYSHSQGGTLLFSASEDDSLYIFGNFIGTKAGDFRVINGGGHFADSVSTAGFIRALNHAILGNSLADTLWAQAFTAAGTGRFAKFLYMDDGGIASDSFVVGAATTQGGVTKPFQMKVDQNTGTQLNLENATAGNAAYVGIRGLSGSSRFTLNAYDDGHADANLADKTVLSSESTSSKLMLAAEGTGADIEMYQGGIAAINLHQTWNQDGDLIYSNPVGGTFNIKASTPDASDTTRFVMSGGGDFAQDRGASIVVYGADYAAAALRGDLNIWLGDTGEYELFDAQGNLVWKIDATGQATYADTMTIQQAVLGTGGTVFDQFLIETGVNNVLRLVIDGGKDTLFFPPPDSVKVH